MKFKEISIDENSLQTYSDLFKSCFPKATHLCPAYLRWLYAENPCGKAIGFDAWSGGELAAHYACIPTRLYLLGKEVDALLAVNTATHPNHRGKGLFVKLASMTYDLGFQEGHKVVYAVGNSRSTPGGVNKLGWQVICPLEARLGFGRQMKIDWEMAHETAQFRRIWDGEQLEWRTRNPLNPIRMVPNRRGYTDIYADTDKKGISVWGELPFTASNTQGPVPGPVKPILYMGTSPTGSARKKYGVHIPRKLRPAPLNLSLRYLDLRETERIESACFSFIDFDVY